MTWKHIYNNENATYFSPITIRITSTMMFEWVKTFRICDRNNTTHSDREIQRTGLYYIYARVALQNHKRHLTKRYN